MKITDTSTPVYIVNCKIGSLGILRSLGTQGVSLIGIDDDSQAPGFMSRYCKQKHHVNFDEGNYIDLRDNLLNIASKNGHPGILIPTSDETSVFVAEYANELSKFFVFPQIKVGLVKNLMSKEGMYQMANQYGVPTPYTLFPRSEDDVFEYSRETLYPVMLKGILGNRLQERTGKKMVIVNSPDELVENYRRLEDPEIPNLMIQEYIPGGDDQVYIFNGYFDKNSDCLAAFTGHKIRQFPIHVGCASLGECRWHHDVAEITSRFMKDIGYRGILDIGYRLDPRDGKYKVLDINPRIGQAFRMFVDKDGMDVVRALYMDLTRQEIPPIKPREGRRWIIEDFDLVSTIHYFQEGSLGFGQWVKSFRRLEEGAWFSWRDPYPFLNMVGGIVKKMTVWILKKLRIVH